MTVRFNTKDRPEFFQTLNQRVNEYFKKNNVSRYGGWELFLKTFIMLAVFWGGYALILLGNLSRWEMLIVCVFMGISMAGIGMCVMHDANHNAYCKSRKINRIIGYVSDLVGVSSFNWQIKHNLLHHTFTNIHGIDEDIEVPTWLLRFTPYTTLYKIHRYQHLYAFFLYGFLTVEWVFTKDFFSFFRYKNNPEVHFDIKKGWQNFAIMVAFKLLYVFLILVLPLMLLDLLWWELVVGFLVIQFIAGTILSNIFQLAHVVERTKLPKIPETGTMKNSWAIHQLKTTVNFAAGSAFMRWFTGGLTNQVEHHLFPNISHVHYGNIATIVKKTAQEFQLPYLENKTLWQGLRSHYRLLWRLGRERDLPDLDFDH